MAEAGSPAVDAERAALLRALRAVEGAEGTILAAAVLLQGAGSIDKALADIGKARRRLARDAGLKGRARASEGGTRGLALLEALHKEATEPRRPLSETERLLAGGDKEAIASLFARLSADDDKKDQPAPVPTLSAPKRKSPGASLPRKRSAHRVSSR